MHINTRRALSKLAESLDLELHIYGQDDCAIALRYEEIGETVTTYKVEGGWIIAWEDKNGYLRSSDLPSRRKSNTYRYTVAYHAQELADAGIRVYRSPVAALRHAIIDALW